MNHNWKIELVWLKKAEIYWPKIQAKCKIIAESRKSHDLVLENSQCRYFN